MKTPHHKTPKRLRPSIRRDVINPSDYMKYEIRSSCEDCTHYSMVKDSCTIGYIPVPHKREKQLKDYELSGRMALCRFMEID